MGEYDHDSQYPLYNQNSANINVSLFAPSLGVNHSLKEFTLSGWSIGDAGMRSLCDAVVANKTTATLNLRWANTSLKGIKAIGNLLLQDSVVTHINLSYSGISAEWISHLVEPLEENDTLKGMNLNGNKDLGDDGVVQICQSLKHNKGLTSLIVGYIDSIGERGIAAIVDAVKVHPSIRNVGNLRNVHGPEWEELRYYLDRMKRNFANW